MKEYNGHRSWNAWNVALWIGNDESLYQLAMLCLSECRLDPAKAARMFRNYYVAARTPDGAAYNQLSVKEALAGLIE